MAQYRGIFLAVMIVFVCYEGAFVDAVCPNTVQEAEMQAKTCLRRVGMDMEAGSSLGNDINQVTQYCRNDAFNNTLMCVQKIRDDCAATNKDLALELDSQINIKRLRDGFQYLCNNMQVIIDNAQCVSDQQEGVMACVQAETKKLQAEVQKKQQSGEQPTKEDVAELSCRFLRRLSNCQHDLYEAGCSKEFSDLMTNYLASMTPPACDKYSGASTVSISWSLLAGLFTLFLYMRE